MTSKTEASEIQIPLVETACPRMISLGVSPDTGAPFFVLAENEVQLLNYRSAAAAAQEKSEATGRDCRLPSPREMMLLFNKVADLGLDCARGYPSGWYWTSEPSLFINGHTQTFPSVTRFEPLDLEVSVRLVCGPKRK